jgi:hypothetical protein
VDPGDHSSPDEPAEPRMPSRRPPGPRRRPLAERFWSKVDRGGPDECWIWRGHVSRNGYGWIKRDGDRKARHLGAHQAAYLLEQGEIPADSVIHHTCGQRACVNPAHLVAVTQKENVRDRFLRGASDEPILHRRSRRLTSE